MYFTLVSSVFPLNGSAALVSGMPKRVNSCFFHNYLVCLSTTSSIADDVGSGGTLRLITINSNARCVTWHPAHMRNGTLVRIYVDPGMVLYHVRNV